MAAHVDLEELDALGFTIVRDLLPRTGPASTTALRHAACERRGAPSKISRAAPRHGWRTTQGSESQQFTAFGLLKSANLLREKIAEYSVFLFFAELRFA